MDETVRERILANIKTTIEGITVINGYHSQFTPKTVQRWSMYGNTSVDTPFLIIVPGEQEQSPLENSLSSCDMRVLLQVFFIHNKKDTVSTDTHLNRLEGDIKKAIMVDETRGGNAKSTQIVGTAPFDVVPEQVVAGLIVGLSIQYRYLVSDPTVAR